jgi:predicted nuclease of predicted toxin-antitoxin system
MRFKPDENLPTELADFLAEKNGELVAELRRLIERRETDVISKKKP